MIGQDTGQGPSPGSEREPETQQQAGLPKLLTGRRRSLMAGLVLTGLGMAALLATSAFLMARMLSTGRDSILPSVAGLTGAAMAIGLLGISERVLAEKLGQNYVQDIRKGLVRASLSTGSRTPIGITVARTTNDLSSVRNWITLGLAPLTVAVPVFIGTAVALWFLSPPLAVAGIAPICFLAIALGLLSGPVLSRAGDVRRRRGRLAAQIADTVKAAASIHAAGGTNREVRRIGRLGEQVATAAVEQARITGYLRASATIAASASVVAVAGTGAWLSISTATIAAAFTVVGMISAPVIQMGRVVEYRQRFLAARRIIGPALNGTRRGERRHRSRSEPNLAGPDTGDGTVDICNLSLGSGRVLPPLSAQPGDRVVIRSVELERATAVCRTLLGLRPGSSTSWPPATVRIDGRELLVMPPAERRRIIGYAARGASLERGSIARALRYRRPDLPENVAGQALARVGLAGRIAELPAGVRTQLRGGGEPLTCAERARLQLARALLGDPPLVVLDCIDSDLGSKGSRMAEELLRSYPGVVLIASENPVALAKQFRAWDIDQLPANQGADIVDARP